MINTYILCKGWSLEDKMLYVEECNYGYCSDDYKKIEGVVGSSVFIACRDFGSFEFVHCYSLVNCEGLKQITLADLKPKQEDGIVSGDLIEVLFQGFNRITSASCYDEAYDIACEMLDLEVAKEDKPKRTKVEFVNVGFHKCHEAMFEHEMEGALYGLICNEFKKATRTYISNNWESGLYRKVKVEMTEREAFIESAMDEFFSNGGEVRAILGKMFDSGKYTMKGE